MSDIASVNCTIPCNLCGGSDVEILGTIDRKGKPLQTVICRECGLVWVDPRPSAKETKKFYAEEYRKQYKATFEPKKKHVFRDMHRAIRRFQRIKPLLKNGMKVLDVGAGGGFFPYAVKSNGYEVSGIEPNRGYAQYAMEELQLDVKVGFIQDIDFPVESFDVITINHVLEHLEDPKAILSRLFDWNKPGTYLNVEVPNIEATYHAPTNKFHLAHLYTFNPANLKLLGQRVGYLVHDAEIVSGTDHINIIFRKPECSETLEYAAESSAISGNFESIKELFDRHTTASHYLSAMPYTRFFRKNIDYLKEFVAVRKFKRGKEIADYIITEQSQLHN